MLLGINDPTSMYQSPDNIITEALCGSAYKEIYTRAQSNQTGNLPLLVILIFLWNDATHIDTAGRFKFEPLSCSPLIFKDQLSPNKRFWGMLGYV